jgi:phenylpropionate dioxygenase-like ring-hydroxylating dioxygenase large terminal subunit
MDPDKWLRDMWYSLLWSTDLKPGWVLARQALGERLVIFRTDDGTVAALADHCPHRLAPLSMGRIVDGNRLQCHYHGLQFDVNGRCVHNPHGNHATPAALAAKSYCVEERHSVIWLWSGDGPPNPRTIPDFGFIDAADARYIADLDYLHVRCNWRFLMNNLMDLSHTSYIHQGILGDPEMDAAKVRVESGKGFVSVTREPIETSTPGLFVPLLAEPRARSMKWNVSTWCPPGSIRIDTGVYPPGGMKDEGTGFKTMHLLTPETDRTTHYMFTSVRWNPLNDPAKDEEIRRAVSSAGRYAFEHQDLPVIEAQQTVMDQLGDKARPVLLASIDEGPVRMQRAIDQMLEGTSGLNGHESL